MKTVFLNIHATGISGSIDYFRDFLLRNNYNIISVYNPLDNYFNKETVVYYNGNVIKRYKRRNLNLFIDFLQNFNGPGLAPYNDLSGWIYFLNIIS